MEKCICDFSFTFIEIAIYLRVLEGVNRSCIRKSNIFVNYSVCICNYGDRSDPERLNGDMSSCVIPSRRTVISPSNHVIPTE